jgi:predicted O-methyltransferase YrrM
MDIVHPAIERYLRDLASVHDEQVLLEMEALAEERGFPIVGRLCGQMLEVMARSVGARRIFELGSGFGFSAYWFARATGPGGEIHLTDGDPENKKLAEDFLERAGFSDRTHFHVGDAITEMNAHEGEFDVVYCDIDKDGYADAWAAARERVRVGGLYMCDNMLWFGRVTDSYDEPDDRPDWTQTINATNLAIATDPDWRSFILPTRDGVVAAIRIR